jgi:6-pyruvoyltetrahydropterin/6-carboxytetrahydropterin synthase
MIVASRYHDFSCGHRVYGHESKCAHLHGHNYRIHFSVAAPELDEVGRVLDFSVINSRLCQWLEKEWDHKFLVWQEDPWAEELKVVDDTVVVLPFNPTAEKMADFLLRVMGPKLLEGTDCVLVKVTVEETRKCEASAMIPPSLAVKTGRT